MAADPNLIRDLASAGIDPDLLQRVVLELARGQASIAAAEKAEAERVAKLEAAAVAKREANAERQRIRRVECHPTRWAELRAAVFERDGHRCRYCGCDGEPLEADHLLPLSRGGRSEMGNLVCSCRPCNTEKGNRTPEEWGITWR